MGMYNFQPLEIIESFQNYGMDDIHELSLDELKKEYIRSLTEKKDLEEELEDLKNQRASDYAVRERIDNATKYIEKIEKILNTKVSDEEMERIKKSVQSRYDKKKDEDDEE